jgi:hypothetical protein
MLKLKIMLLVYVAFVGTVYHKIFMITIGTRTSELYPTVQ